MTGNELKVLEIIWDWGGEASVDTIAREAGISPNYAELLCRSLARQDYIDFLHSKLSKIKSKGKIVVAEKSRFGLGKPRRILTSQDLRGRDKRRRLILNYG